MPRHWSSKTTLTSIGRCAAHAQQPRLQTSGVGSSEEALLRFREQRPDLILLDVHLPGADGYRLACASALPSTGDAFPSSS